MNKEDFWVLIKKGGCSEIEATNMCICVCFGVLDRVCLQVFLTHLFPMQPFSTP